MISNVQILRALPAGSSPSEVAVKCRFLIYRNRVETETDLLVGKRQDLLRRVDAGWKIARRMIVLDQNVLLAKNLTSSCDMTGPRSPLRARAVRRV